MNIQTHKCGSEKHWTYFAGLYKLYYVVNAITASCASDASLACCAWSSGHCSNALSALIVTYESSTSPLKVIQVFVVPVVLYMIQLRYSKEIAQLHSVLCVKYWYHCQQIALDKRNISISLILSTINILYIIYQKGSHCWPIPRYVMCRKDHILYRH